MQSRLLGRLVTSPIAFLVGGIADLVIYGVGSARRARRARGGRSRAERISA
jgi:hypothetical protein